MTITQLEYTLAVSRYGNFTLAAEKSFVTQPTLSMQVQKLEEELGVRIFNRNAKPIKVTPIGEKILEQAKTIIEETHRVADIVAIEKGVIAGTFNLGILPTVMPTLLPIFLNNFIKKYPRVDLKIEEHTTENMERLLVEGKLDAGIAATPLNHDKIKERPLYYEPFVGYVPPSHLLANNQTLTVEAIENTEMLVLEDGHCFRHHVLNLCQTKNKQHPRFDLKSGSFETLIHLADQGLGMTLLPYLQTLNMAEKSKENLRHFEHPVPAREISLIFSKAQLKTPIINVLHDLIASVIRGLIQLEEVRIIAPK